MSHDRQHFFAFRIQFNLAQHEHLNCRESQLDVPDSGLTFRAVGGGELVGTHELDVRQTGFASLKAAQQAGEELAEAICLALVKLDCGFDLGRFRLPTAVFTSHGLKWAAEIFHLPPDTPVRTAVHGLDVYEDDPDLRFVESKSECKVGRAPDGFIDAIRSALRRGIHLSNRQRLAMELFGLALSDSSPRAGFLHLISSAEVLAEPQRLSSDVDRVVEHLLNEVKNAGELEGKASLDGRLRELKRESIRRACRRVVEGCLGEAAAKIFEGLYDKRNTLLHEGEVPGCDWTSARNEAHRLVRELLLQSVGKA